MSNIVVKIMSESGLNVRQVARAIGVSPYTVHSWVNNRGIKEVHAGKVESLYQLVRKHSVQNDVDKTRFNLLTSACGLSPLQDFIEEHNTGTRIQ